MSLSRGKTPIVAVCGGHETTPGYAKIAEEVGALVAKEGWYLICGGLTGVMHHASKGARENGGFTIGILPGDDVTAANPFIDLPIASGVGYMRNSIIITTADAVIAIDGAEGTLSEMCYALTYEKPMVVVSREDGVKQMGGIAIDVNASSGFVLVYNAEDAIVKTKELLGLA
ncbi:MAG: TIGR00725 family protein [Promethearchaeota archaeon]